MARAKSAQALADPRRVLIYKIIEEGGPVTQGQLVKLTGMSWGQVQWHLYVLEREGKVKRVVKNGVTFYTTPRQAIELLPE
ncbi:MAG: helix-turn-helix transcriptional regulator [Pyrobaculum sp.]